jgi:thioredoxin reductase (NADPH)
MPEHRKVIIIGSGPAGLTAALYTARADLKPLVFEGLQPGGQLTITTDVENYPGFPDGVMGPDMMDLFRTQAQRFGAETEFKIVTKVDLSQRPLGVWVDDEAYTADVVIIATGASAKLLGIPGERELMGHGLSACATCDGFFFHDKHVFVVGGGDTAMEEANFLTRFCSKVTIVHRREELRASKIMQQRAVDNPKIDFLWNTVITEYLGDPAEGGLTGVRLRSTVEDKTWEQEIDGVFLGIGHRPNTDLFADQLTMDDNGYLITKPDRSATEIDGVYACGDVQDHYYRQAVTAAGSGCAAAIEAERWLEAQGL